MFIAHALAASLPSSNVKSEPTLPLIKCPSLLKETWPDMKTRLLIFL